MVGFRRIITGVAFVASVVGAQKADALTINLIDYNHSVQGTAAAQGFAIAANYWSSIITTNATVNLQIGYSALGTTVIGSTYESTAIKSTTSIYQALASTGNSALDALAVSNLRPLDANGGLSFIAESNSGNVVSKTKIYDTDDSANNTLLDVNTATLKALGFTGYSSTVDAQINFSSNFAFDFNPTDGIAAGKVDFIAMAVHEIGHALGFTSGVDTYDQFAAGTKSPYSGLTANLNSSAIFSTLDLFRYSGDLTGLVPGPGQALDLAAGSGSYFSIDGKGMFNGAQFSTGQYAGNGRQASHWKDATGCDAQIGLMDPTLCRAQMGVVTDDDIAAMDALGWNVGIDALNNIGYTMTTAQMYANYMTMLSQSSAAGPNGQAKLLLAAVPEPANWATMAIGFVLIGGTIRRRRSAKALAA